MYYLYINGSFTSNFRTLKGLVEYVSNYALAQHEYPRIIIMEGLRGHKYAICPLVLDYLHQVLSVGSSAQVQALGESVDINDYIDLADLFRKYRTERLYLGEFDIIHSSGECIDTVYR